jgi:hypothetical protein
LLATGGWAACGDSASADNDSTTEHSHSGSGGGGSGGAGGKPVSSNGGSSSSKLAGTGDSCQSYTEAKDGMCAGWFCGVSEDELMAAVDPKANCGGNVPLLCAGEVVKKVGICARRLKGENFNKTNDELRPLVRDCVYEDAEVKAAVPESCLNCTIDAAACAADHCLAQCLAGDSPLCDTCRRDNGCDQGVFECGGLPAPID